MEQQKEAVAYYVAGINTPNREFRNPQEAAAQFADRLARLGLPSMEVELRLGEFQDGIVTILAVPKKDGPLTEQLDRFVETRRMRKNIKKSNQSLVMLSVAQKDGFGIVREIVPHVRPARIHRKMTDYAEQKRERKGG